MGCYLPPDPLNERGPRRSGAGFDVGAGKGPPRTTIVRYRPGGRRATPCREGYRFARPNPHAPTLETPCDTEGPPGG